MYKNQLQELAQRSCFNLPAYSCIREGPDHAPRFRATVNFNGEIFESPNYFSTLRQAEHAAAEVALNTLSRRGPSQSLATKMLDETGVCKNLLQETLQRAGVSLPVYMTSRSGPGHLPVFTSTVKVAGMTVTGEPAKTKKQAEKNAAMAAWSALKQWSNVNSSSVVSPDSEALSEEHEQNLIVLALAKASGKEIKALGASGLQQSQYPVLPSPTRIRVVRAREASGQAGARSATQYPSGTRVSVDMPSDSVQSPRYSNQKTYRAVTLPRSRLAGPVYDSPKSHDSQRVQDSQKLLDSARLVREALAATKPGGGTDSVGNLVPVQTRILPVAMCRETHGIILPYDEHQRDEEEWLKGDICRFSIGPNGNKDSTDLERVTSMAHCSLNSVFWSDSSPWWSNPHASHVTAASHVLRPAMSLAPPVRVRPMVAVNAAPPPRPEPDDSEIKSGDEEAATRQVLSQLSL